MSLVEHLQTGGSVGFALESAPVWNFLGLAPESSRTLPGSLAMAAALAVLSGAAACGPSNGGGNPATYVIVFELTDTEDDLTGLTFTVDPAFGNFSGTGNTVDCGLVENVGDSATFVEDATGKLTVTIVATSVDLEEGDKIVECDLVSTVQPTADDFDIVITAAAPSDIEDVTVLVTSTEPEGASLTSGEPSDDEEAE